MEISIHREGKRTFLAEEVMVPGKMIMPFAMFFSSRMLSNLEENKVKIRNLRMVCQSV
jgi:hypothetical protein